VDHLVAGSFEYGYDSSGFTESVEFIFQLISYCQFLKKNYVSWCNHFWL